MYDVTVGEVLKSRENLLVQFAAEKRLGIQATRDLLQTVAPQTLLRNAVKSDPLSLGEVSISAYHEYERWLDVLTRRFGFDGRSSLFDAVSGRRRNLMLKNLKRSVGPQGQQTYGFGLQASQDRDPWLEITVGCAQHVLELTGSVKEEAVRCASASLGPRVLSGTEELQRYVNLRLRGNGVVGGIAKPVARIVCLAMSTNPKSTRMRCATRPDKQSPYKPLFGEDLGGSSTWREIIETMVQEVRCWKRRGVPVLIVLDCALGWPQQMAVSIASHAAGNALERGPEATPSRRTASRPQDRVDEQDEVDEVHFFGGDSQPLEEAEWREERNRFFRRQTEIHVRDRLRSVWGKPYGPYGLDIGADKSARTTHQALRLLDVLRRELHEELPVLATWCGPITQSSVIEVTTVGRRTREHTRSVDPRRTDRANLLEPLGPNGVKDEGTDAERESTRRVFNQRRAVEQLDWMLHTATAFLNGGLQTPRDAEVDDEVAQKEGWIWATY